MFFGPRGVRWRVIHRSRRFQTPKCRSSLYSDVYKSPSRTKFSESISCLSRLSCVYISGRAKRLDSLPSLLKNRFHFYRIFDTFWGAGGGGMFNSWENFQWPLYILSILMVSVVIYYIGRLTPLWNFQWPDEIFRELVSINSIHVFEKKIRTHAKNRGDRLNSFPSGPWRDYIFNDPFLCWSIHGGVVCCKAKRHWFLRRLAPSHFPVCVPESRAGNPTQSPIAELFVLRDEREAVFETIERFCTVHRVWRRRRNSVARAH